MIDTIAERLIPLSQIPAAAIPGWGDKPVDLGTLDRWCLYGVRGIPLESVMVGGRRYTSIDALNRFCQAVTAAPPRSGPPPIVVGSRPRREHARAGQKDVASSVPGSEGRERGDC